MQAVYILRFVPDTKRGEFINVGVLCGNNEDGWALRYLTDTERMISFGGSQAADKAHGALKEVYEADLDSFDHRKLEDWVAEQRGTVQLGHGGAAPGTPHEAADSCFDMFVETAPFPVTQPA